MWRFSAQRQRSSRGNSTPETVDHGVIDTLCAEGYAVESICRVLREQGCQIAARTYRAWKRQQPAARTISDALVMNAILTAGFTTDAEGRRRLSPEGLYGRRKMTAYLRRNGSQVAACTVDRCMRTLGRTGVRRGKKVPTTIPADTDQRAADLLDRKFTAAEPNRIWIAEFSYVRTWVGFGYVAFIVDVFAQRIVGWHVWTGKATDLVMIPLRMALWQRQYDGHPTKLGQLIHRSDSEYRHAGVSGFPDHRRGARQDAGAGWLSGFLTRTSD
jgi:putative transposase